MLLYWVTKARAGIIGWDGISIDVVVVPNSETAWQVKEDSES
jgi:hypothetical protein